MSRKLVIDCDPGIDDAVALCMALFEPRFDVVAITATEGRVDASQSTRNVQAIIDQLDPPRFPRLGVASPLATAPPVDGRVLDGQDGLGNAGFVVSELHHQHPAEKLICDVVRAAPDDVTILALGPLTNIAKAFQRDPQLPSMVGHIIMMGGSVACIGDVTAAAEFNTFYDPRSARAVFRSPTTKTLIPLDVTRQVLFSLGLVDELPDERSRVGAFLRRILPHTYRAHRQSMGVEGIYLHSAVALLAALHPELFETEEMAGDVETAGEVGTGATFFDRRPVPSWRVNMDVATDVDLAAATDSIIRGLQQGGRATC